MHKFTGIWITDEEFYNLKPRNVFHKQLPKIDLPCNEHRNRHILFRKAFDLAEPVECGKIYISADDYYKLYINGTFVAQGPTPSYHFQYNYNVIDVTDYLKQGENVIAVHTLYQGLINRVWQSGDNRHGLIMDMYINDVLCLCSDDSFKTAPHTAYREMSTVGYDTQFMEEYNSNGAEVGFEQPDYDDSAWAFAKVHLFNDHTLTEQKSSMLEFEKICPIYREKRGNVAFFDFGSNYVGYLNITVRGKKGDVVTVRCGQELDKDGSVRYKMRCNCDYEESWILSGGESQLDWFDYKTFRYAELILPHGCEITDVHVTARHYPFKLNAFMQQECANDDMLRKIWHLCVHSLRYGVQEVIQDCMDREKGFYVGDGCYTALTHMMLTGDDSMVRKLIDDCFATDFITDGLVTCLDCSFMQEIAEFPLILTFLVLWHYRLTGDEEYLKTNYPKAVKVLESYRRDYEKDGILSNLDKWCVVEWPMNFRDGYDVDILEGKVCEEAHVSINAYYIEAVNTVNKIAKILGEKEYRDTSPLISAFINVFYDRDKKLFKDGANTAHTSIVGNIFPFAFGIVPDSEFTDNVINMLMERKISSLSLFCTFVAFMGLVRMGKRELIKDMMKDEGAWMRMLKEGATTTFEGWGKDTKWNTSLFHLTMTYGAVFLSDYDLEALFE